MKDDLSAELVRRYPELFMNKEFRASCGDGWFNLINVVCLELYSDYNSAKSLYELCLLNCGKPMYHWIDTSPIVTDDMVDSAHRELLRRLSTLPKIEAIYGRYGSLRVKVVNATPFQIAKLDFATILSTHICEECGNSSPNQINCLTSGIHRTLCNSCKNKFAL